MMQMVLNGEKPMLTRLSTAVAVSQGQSKPAKNGYKHPWPFKVGNTALMRYKVKEAFQNPVGPFTMLESKRP